METTTFMDSTETATPAPLAPGFHRLRVAGVQRLTDDAITIGLQVPEALRETFRHRPGQHLTVHHIVDGRELRRSYSICTPPWPPEPEELRILVKRLGGGGFAEHAVRRLAVGDDLHVGPPTGGFQLAGQRGAHHVLFAGGSGITPLQSMAVAALREDPECRVSLVYASRTAMSALLADELADLKDAWMERFFVAHVLSREMREPEVLSGRIDATRVPKLLELVGAAPDERAHFYLCGPMGLVESVRAGLAGCGVDESRIRFELFSVDGETYDGETGGEPEQEVTGTRVTARLRGRTTETVMTPQDRVILDAVVRARPETPYSCRDGLCGTCRAKVLRGEVRMDRQYALGREEIGAGYTLACRARPVTEDVELDFDS